MVLSRSGPVAAIGATTTSHPLPNFFSGQCFLKSLDAPGDRRLGTLWLASEVRAAAMRNLIVERVLLEVEGKLEPNLDMARLRRDHALMYALLGDGATRLRAVEPMTVRVTRAADGGRWQVDRPADATELVVGLRPAEPPPVTVDGQPRRERARKNFTAANAAFAFEPLAKLPAYRKWEGSVGRAGRLRLVAVAPGKLYVATAVLSVPPAPPSGPAKPTDAK
jgi:hypothetical protein